MSGECPVNRTVYGRPCDGPGSYYCDGDLWGSKCRAYYEQKREEPEPAAPVVQGADELRDDAWWTRVFLAVQELVDSVPYADGSKYPVPHAAAFRAAVEPELARLLQAQAAVQRVRELADRNPGSQWSKSIRRALDAS
jgi:hypothetical protein